MPITLDCVCPDADIAVCTLDALTLVVDVTETQFGTPAISAGHSLTFYADKNDPSAPSIQLINPSPGEQTFDLPLVDWVNRWDKIVVELGTDSSLFQVPSPAFSAYDKFWATYYIRQDYTCVNPENSAGTTHPQANAYTKDPQDSTKCEPDEGDVRCVCYAGQGIGSIFYKSTTLATCSGCTIQDRDFEPAVDSAAKVDISSGNWCLCASGGSGHYSYSLIEGALPSGMSIDPSSGCISGIATGKKSGTKLIKFSAADLNTGDTAIVTCGVLGTTCSGGAFGNQAY